MLLRTTPFHPLYNSMTLLNATQTNAVFSLSFATKPRSSLLLLSPSTPTDSSFALSFNSLPFQQPHLNLGAVCGNGLRLRAVKKQRKGGGVVEMDDFDENDDDDEGEDFSEEEEDEVLPFEQMKKWLESKPRGFGVGKVYDTSVEDKLLDEMRKSREAQAANVNKLKNNPIMPGTEKNEPKKKALEVQSGVVRVRLMNLPKKKNIHRDLKVAFQGTPGIVDITPVVSGNKKTRDPVCKGFAFVLFKCEEDAARFVQLYSEQNISFGKIQKQITFEILDEDSSASARPKSSKNLSGSPQLMEASAIEESPNEDSDIDDSAFVSQDKTASRTEEQVGENEEIASTLNVDGDGDGNEELQSDPEINPLSLEQQSPAKLKKERVAKKKPPSKEKAKKVPKLVVPGSAKRLKIREKAVLSDVFSKYGSKPAFASKDS